MDVMILLEVKVRPDKADALKGVLRDMLVDTRAFDGCVSVAAIQDQDDPGSVILVQRWASRAHYERYSAWRAETGAANSATARLSASYGLRYFDPVNV